MNYICYISLEACGMKKYPPAKVSHVKSNQLTWRDEFFCLGISCFFLIWVGFHVWVPVISDFAFPLGGWGKYWRLKRESRTNSQNILLRGAVNSHVFG